MQLLSVSFENFHSIYFRFHVRIGYFGLGIHLIVRGRVGRQNVMALGVNNVTVSAEHKVLDVDLWSLEPLVCIDDPPDENHEEGTTVHQAGPVHVGGTGARREYRGIVKYAGA